MMKTNRISLFAALLFMVGLAVSSCTEAPKQEEKPKESAVIDSLENEIKTLSTAISAQENTDSLKVLIAQRENSIYSLLNEYESLKQEHALDSERLAMFEAINSQKREDSLALAKMIEEREKKLNEKAKADSARNALVQEILREMYQIRVDKIDQSTLSAADYEFQFTFGEKLFKVMQKALKNKVNQKYTFEVVPLYKGDDLKKDSKPVCTKDAKIDVDTYKCIVPMKQGNRELTHIIVYHLDNNSGAKNVIGGWKK